MYKDSFNPLALTSESMFWIQALSFLISSETWEGSGDNLFDVFGPKKLIAFSAMF